MPTTKFTHNPRFGTLGSRNQDEFTSLDISHVFNHHKSQAMLQNDGHLLREDGLPEPMCVQYCFSQTVPTGKGITTHIRLLSICDKMLATVHGDRDVLMWNLAYNTPPQRVDIDMDMDRVTGIAFSPTSSSVIALTFILGGAHEAWTYDWTTRTPEARLQGGSDFHSVQFSPDGRLLAFISGRNIEVRETLINTHVATLREGRRKTTSGLPGVSKFAFTPDSRWIAMLDGTGRMTIRAAGEASWVHGQDRESLAKTAWDGVGREAMQLVADGRRVMAACRQTDGTSPWTWRLTTWWPENGSRAELEMNGCAFACVPRHGNFVATVQADGGRLRIRDSSNGVCLDQSTQGIAKTGKTPLVIAGTIAVGDRVMVTQIANGRTTVWKLTAVD